MNVAEARRSDDAIRGLVDDHERLKLRIVERFTQPRVGLGFIRERILLIGEFPQRVIAARSDEAWKVTFFERLETNALGLEDDRVTHESIRTYRVNSDTLGGAYF